MTNRIKAATVFLLSVLASIACDAYASELNAVNQAALQSVSVPLIVVDGRVFKDLNRNRRLDAYEDWRKPAAERARDLVKRMTLDEKAGALMHGTPPTVDGGLRGDWDFRQVAELIQNKHITAFISRLSGDSGKLAQVANQMQEEAERARLAIPVSISSDPRNHFQNTLGASVEAGGFSQWPETTGLAAIGDVALVRRFADIARQEYLATGIRVALSPMADLATEPRWPRINGTFGEDAQLSMQLVQAYVEGFQNGDGGLNRDSVAAVVKHWVGYGASANGYDAHNPYGKELAFPANNFAQHLLPFTGAFAAKVSGVMPTYALPASGVFIDGRAAERVGAAFSRQMLSELLRARYGFQGVVLTDWLITNDCPAECVAGTLDIERIGMPWGVETVSVDERFARAIDAGVDQFGGVMNTEIVVSLVKRGRVKEDRLDESVFRIELQKFQQGLFENPYVDAEHAKSVVGNPHFNAEALDAQRRSQVLLENKRNVLPLKGEVRKLFLYGVSPQVAASYGYTVVEQARDADVAILRMSAPYQTRTNYFFGARQHEGDLAFQDGNADYRAFLSIPSGIPLVVSVYLDRPAILTNIRDKASALLANFGASDGALFDVLTGRARPEGRLPFELPSSMAAVMAQQGDAAHDSANPLYPIFYGLRY